ncbi:hypothetical protein G9A89_000189, partial [Geosiphon pyriformis]
VPDNEWEGSGLRPPALGERRASGPKLCNIGGGSTPSLRPSIQTTTSTRIAPTTNPTQILPPKTTQTPPTTQTTHNHQSYPLDTPM